MTGYYITVGYNSAYNKEDVWDELKKIVQEICDNPEIIIDEVMNIEGINIPIEYAESYRSPCKDLTIKIIEGSGDEDKEYCIQQYASGGSKSRDYKECMRRAFCRLVLNRIHRIHMEININVT